MCVLSKKGSKKEGEEEYIFSGEEEEQELKCVEKKGIGFRGARDDAQSLVHVKKKKEFTSCHQQLIFKLKTRAGAA